MIKEIAGRLLRYDFSGVEMIEADRVFVKVAGKKKTVGGANAAQTARALTLLAKNDRGGDFEISQTPHFDRCGVMLDVSRNGVMRVDAVCEYISYMALYGFNYLMLYMEDIFELDDYPRFGYLRGRYSLAELKQIDDFALRVGVEVVPCVQTLGHLNQYLRWGEATEIRDTGSVLLCGEEKTDQFIESVVKTMRAAFCSNRIHIGMDEAHDVGLGAYLTKNGFRDRFTLLNEHLERVTQICKKYNYEPMMWSDMFFCTGSKTGNYYDCDSVIPEDVLHKIPDVGMVYWDYYHTDEDFYKEMIKKHRAMKKALVFAGGIWTWSGFLPDMGRTNDTMVPALKACCAEGVKDVVAACWADDGCETNYFFSLYGLSLFSEFCYLGGDATQTDVSEMAEFVTRFSKKAIDAMNAFQLGQEGHYGKRLVWSDVLYNLTGVDWGQLDYDTILSEGIAVLKKEGGENAWYYEYAAAVLEVAKKKASILSRLRNQYKAKQDLSEFSADILPRLYEDYERLCALHLRLWKKTYKMNGWEVLGARYGAMQNRVKYAINTIKDYENGDADAIEELECAILHGDIPSATYARMAVTSELL